MTQRLKQHNEGFRFRLQPGDLLIAFAVSGVQGGFRHARVRVERAGFAGLSVHTHAAQYVDFRHCSTQIDRPQIAALQSALLAALAALTNMRQATAGDDPDGSYHNLHFWRDQEAIVLRMRYVGGVPCESVPAFESAWQLMMSQFPTDA